MLGRWLLCWLLLPNLGFWALWTIATPPRASAIVITATIGLIVRHAPYAVRLGGFAVALAYSVLLELSLVFNLGISDIVESSRFFAELDPLRSPAYVAAMLLAAALVAVAGWLCRGNAGFRSGGDLALASLAIVAAAGLDHAVSFTSRGSYKRLAPADAAFESAVAQTRFAETLGSGRHVLVVVMEAMGSPRHPAVERLMFEPWRSPAIAARYDVRFGSTAFYGSTTNAEMRELCGRWADYRSVTDGPAPHCLPALAAARGHATTALHGFEASFFDRETWYPNVGFERMLFDEALHAEGVGGCDGVFPGGCDRDVPALLARRLKTADRPQFLYWLTLNSHLPVPRSGVLDTEDCEARHPELADMSGGLCRLVSVTRMTAAGLARMLADPALPATEVLIVGDHMPPFFDHASRSQFDPRRVPWIRLTPRQAADAR